MAFSFSYTPPYEVLTIGGGFNSSSSSAYPHRSPHVSVEQKRHASNIYFNLKSYDSTFTERYFDSSTSQYITGTHTNTAVLSTSSGAITESGTSFSDGMKTRMVDLDAAEPMNRIHSHASRGTSEIYSASSGLPTTRPFVSFNLDNRLWYDYVDEASATSTFDYNWFTSGIGSLGNSIELDIGGLSDTAPGITFTSGSVDRYVEVRKVSMFGLQWYIKLETTGFAQSDIRTFNTLDGLIQVDVKRTNDEGEETGYEITLENFIFHTY